VGVIIAPMEHGETWTGGDAACVVGNREVNFWFARDPGVSAIDSHKPFLVTDR
jgi:hypothetical protein